MGLKEKGVGKWEGALGGSGVLVVCSTVSLDIWQACGYVAGKQMRDVSSRAGAEALLIGSR